ncbi:NAD-dependent epimerase/dehydratase family protein [Arenimonas daejeonensis]|uniref:NAD-dependent epimerase/dehydratase family protein n=1 Tax=Arenimonas daejeonensis TaxID=370777 RepID=UPI00223EAB5A|nr:NAD-dependent epimerase/dehydratase family protein [Arenimonas daejeonensis]
MTPLKLVILGGTGFVGRHLLARLAADGHAVTLLSRNLASHSDRLLPPGVMLREVDVYDPTARSSRPSRARTQWSTWSASSTNPATTAAASVAPMSS